MREDVIQMEVKIYLKTRKKPFVFVLSNKEQFNHLLDSLCDRFVHFGNIVIPTSDIKFISQEEK